VFFAFLMPVDHFLPVNLLRPKFWAICYNFWIIEWGMVFRKNDTKQIISIIFSEGFEFQKEWDKLKGPTGNEYYW